MSGATGRLSNYQTEVSSARIAATGRSLAPPRNRSAWQDLLMALDRSLSCAARRLVPDIVAAFREEGLGN